MSHVEALPGLGEQSGYETLLGIDQAVLDAIPAAVYVCAADGEVVRFNRRAVELWGRTPRTGDSEERFCGSFRLYQLDGRLLRHDRTPMEHVLRTGEPARDREVVIERPDGSRINVLVNIEPFKNAADDVEGAINCFQDITERRRLEALARDSERRLREILDALPSPIYTTDAEGRITFFNREAAVLAGREPELGKDKWCVSWRLHSPEGKMLAHDECPMAVALKEKRPVRGIDAVAERPDGTRVPFMPHPTPLFDEAGKLTGAVNMLVDLTEQREAGKRLTTSEARYRGIFEGARVALWDQDFSRLLDLLDEIRSKGVTDIRTYFEARPDELAEAVALVLVRDINDYAVELFEADDKEALLGALGATFLPETLPVFLEELVSLWEGKRRFESEAVVRTLKGKLIRVMLTIAWDGERCERSLVSILDISRQKASERRWKTLNRIARTLSQDLDVQRTVQSVTDIATELSGAKFGAFFYNSVNDEGEKYLLYTLSGAPRAAFEKFGLPRNTAVFEPTFRGMEVVRSDDIRTDPRYGKSAPHYGMPKGHLPVVSYLAVPVISRSGEVVGGLFFGHDQSGVFTKESEELVAGIAAHAAIALDNARLLAAAQNEVEHRRRADEASQRLASIVESSADAIVSKDLDGVIVSWNNGAERLFGYTAAEVVGRSITILIPEDHLDEEPKILHRVRHGERIEHYETIRRRKDGTLVDISLTVSPVRNAEGKIVGASKIARDITERKRHELSLSRRAEEQAALYQFTDRLHRAEDLDDVHQSALDAILRALRCSRASILLFDEAGVMRFVAWRGLSDAYRQAVDGHSPWTPEEKAAQPIVMNDVGAADLDDSLRATIEGEGIRALAFIPLVSMGKLIGKFMAYYEEPHTFVPEEIDLAVTIARQLGFSVERLRAAEDLRQNEERFRIATQTGKVGLWEWDIPSNNVSWTDSLYGMHGVTKEEFEASVEGFDSLVHPEDRERVSQALARALEEDAPYELEFRILKPDGGVVWIFTNAVVLREEGQPVRLIGATVDITERKEAELQRDLLVAELSHRVKNTLATVISIARQSFSKGQSVEKASEAFNARIRALAQTHGRLAEANWASVSFQTILLDELAPYRREDGSNIRLSGPLTELNPRCALTLGMALHELATNAAKYGALSTKNGTVDIAWHKDTDARRLLIRWAEAGGPPVALPKRSGFGRLLLERALASDLRGHVELNFAKNGLECEIAIPLEEFAV
jgi:PAS domain S-box-containing protein